MIKAKIGIYGRMNVGKSSLLNQIVGHSVSIVSPKAGTTTDPVRRTFEILDFAPVVFIDTAGFDDRTELGLERVAKTIATLSEIDLAIIVVPDELTDQDNRFIERVTCPYIVVQNADGIIDKIKTAIPLSSLIEPPFFGKRLSQGDIVLLVCPIDSEAPSGRLILPQVQALRAALDTRAIAITVQPSEIRKALSIVTPKLVVTDSQAFAEVTPLIPPGIELTSFSILLSELKGDVTVYKEGLRSLPHLRNGDEILLIEHCSHQSSCEDIARVKIPKLIKQKLGIDLSVTVAQQLPENISTIKLIAQCGGCMTGRRSIISTIEIARRNNIPITNYGMLLRTLQKQS